MFEENVDAAIQEDHKTLCELSRGNLTLPADLGSGWFQVPGPAEICEATEPSSEGEQTVPEEDAAFDKVSQSIEDIVRPENASVGHNTAGQSNKSKDENSSVDDLVHNFGNLYNLLGRQAWNACRQILVKFGVLEPRWSSRR